MRAAPPLPSFAAAARALAAIGRGFYARGWVLGTSGNFSAVVSRRPLRLAITPSAAHKGTLDPRGFLAIDAHGRVAGRARGRPSAETRLHLAIVQARGAGAVLHTHSVWSTLLSDRHAAAGGLSIAGLEMLKGLEGVTSHEHTEWIPIVPNDQDMERLAGVVGKLLDGDRTAHAFLLQGHGLYTWGRTIGVAARHVEILEFLLEVAGRGGGSPAIK
jgi:methylthioribulose-1-phosphate dehydratase